MYRIDNLDELNNQNTQSRQLILDAYDVTDKEKISADLANISRTSNLDVLKFLVENMPFIVSVHRGSRNIYAYSTLSRMLGYNQQ